MTSAAPAESCYGLVVGIGEYQDPNIPRLKFTGADAQAFYNQLVSPEQSGFPACNVKLLINEQATRRNIEKAISGWLFQKATPDSTVVVFFAGHGGQESDKIGGEKDGAAKYLLPWDADLEDLFSSGLSNSRFHELLHTIKAQRLIVFMDACFSAGVSEGARDIGLVESPFQKLAQGQGRIVIASAQPNQRSWEDQTLGHGIFTYHLLEAFGGKADSDDDGCASVMDIFRYLQDAVPLTARRVSQSLQEPVLFGDSISHEVVLTVSQQRVVAAAQRRDEIERLRSEDIKQRRRQLFILHDEGGMPLPAFQEAMLLIEKSRASMPPQQQRLAGLLEALLDGKVSLDIYLGFADALPPTAHSPQPHPPSSKPEPLIAPTPPPPVPQEHRRHVIRPVPDPPKPEAPKPEPPKPAPPAAGPPKQELRFCIFCAAAVIPNNQFCINCGKPYRR